MWLGRWWQWQCSVDDAGSTDDRDENQDRDNFDDADDTPSNCKILAQHKPLLQHTCSSYRQH